MQKLKGLMRLKSSVISGLLFAIMMISFTGCDFIGGVFQTGVGIGAFIVIVIVILILAVRGMGRRR